MASTTPSVKTAATKKLAAAKKRTTAKKVAAKKVAASEGFAPTAVAAESLAIGDVVMLTSSDGTVVGPGRLCAESLVSSTVCVNFPDLGCKKVSRSRLHLAPPGSQAPNCNGCDDC